MSKQFYFKQFSLALIHSLNAKTVSSGPTQFIWTIKKTLSGATTSDQCWPGSNGNKGILCILQSSSITRTSPSNCLMLYQDSHCRESYPSSEIQLVYSTVPANCFIHILGYGFIALTLAWWFESTPNDPGDLGSIPDRVIPKTQKMVLDASLLNTQHYKVRIKGSKVDKSRKSSSALHYTLV